MDLFTDIRIRTASIIGSEHQRRQINNQDALAFGRIEARGQKYLWGIICDGCSAGHASEVGARLTSAYLARQTAFWLGQTENMDKITDRLFTSCLYYLRSLVPEDISVETERAAFISNYLLCTVIGFIISEEEAVVFHAGDGVIVVNDGITRIDQRNMPSYPAYHLLDRRFLGRHTDKLLPEFGVTRYPFASFSRLAVASDGFRDGLLGCLSGHEHPLGLARKIRVMRNQGEVVLGDDCTIILAEKSEADKGGDDSDH